MDIEKKDIASREDIQLLVDSFYDKVKKDETIGFIFTDIVKTNWKEHLPVMYDFWETILLDHVVYTKNAMAVHYEVNRKQPLEEKHFNKWLELFEETVKELFSGPKASLALTRANSIAAVMQFKMQEEHKNIQVKPKS